MPYLLYSRKTSQTGRLLRDVLGIAGGSRGPDERVDVLVRWGSSDSVRFRALETINKRDAIRLAADKYTALRRMQEFHIPVPRTYGANERNMHYPVLGRRTHHTQGRDIVLCLQRMDVERALEAGCTHFTELVPKAREFRVHVFEGEVLKLSEKVLTHPDQYVPWMWNFETGFTFRNVRPIIPAVLERVTAAGIAAVQSLGLDFGAADVCLTDDGHVIVFEVNTGPSLAEKSLGVYARKIAERLGIEVDEEAIQNLEQQAEALTEEVEDDSHAMAT